MKTIDEIYHTNPNNTWSIQKQLPSISYNNQISGNISIHNTNLFFIHYQFKENSLDKIQLLLNKGEKKILKKD